MMNAMAPRVLWVVYRMSPLKSPLSGLVVCEQREWEMLEQINPGYHTLIQAGLSSEMEAEKLARSHSRVAPTLPITQPALL